MRDLTLSSKYRCTAPSLLLEHVVHVRKAIERYRSTAADFADALIGLLNEAAGCEHTVTFDRSLKRSPQFKVI